MIREFHIMGEPKAKQRPRVTRTGIAYTPKETVEYENYVKMSYLEHYDEHPLLEGELTAKIVAYFKIPKNTSKKKHDAMMWEDINPTKKPDCDNLAKSILDSLNGIAYKDDSQIVKLVVCKHYSDVPRVEVALEEKHG